MFSLHSLIYAFKCNSHRSFTPSFMLLARHTSVHSSGKNAFFKRFSTMSAVNNEILVENFRNRISGKVLLAPLTRGGNLPFRRLCADFGVKISYSEMAYARHLTQRKPLLKELALLCKAPNEEYFGVQIATNTIEEGIGAGLLAANAGASFLDLNCGCPIYEATRRGLGSSLLRKPSKLGRLVGDIAKSIPLPLTVKIRSGIKDDEPNAKKVVKVLQEAGVCAVTIHPRSQQQRYTKTADWDLISEICNDPETTIPIIGNGDILCFWEAENRLKSQNLSAIMVGRGALIKPWIFKECSDRAEWLPTAEQRVEVYYKLTEYMKEHFGRDPKGKKKAFYFLPWHFSFFCRYRPIRKALFEGYPYPLLQDGRYVDKVLNDTEGPSGDLSPLEQLLRLTNEEAHLQISEILWESETIDAAIVSLKLLAENQLKIWNQQGGNGIEADSRTEGWG